MNVLSIVSYNFLPPKMGGQKGIGLFNKFLAGYVNLHCVTTKSNAESYAPEYTIIKLLTNSKLRYLNIFYFFSVRKIIKEKGITHLIIEHPYYGWLGILLKNFCAVKLVVHSHNIESERFRSTGKWWWKILKNYERFTHRHADVNFFIQDDDKAYAIENFKLNAAKCYTITYGFELTGKPTAEEKITARTSVCALHHIDPSNNIILFNGTLDYPPNLDALLTILDKINPILLSTEGFKYTIIICGKSLPANLNALKNYADKNIVYAGFVEDINVYFKAADHFINPVVDGGGIKTKLVEALGFDLNVVTTTSGAIGVPQTITGNKMIIVPNNDEAGFATALKSFNTTEHIPQTFFDHFYWGSITEKAVATMANA